MKKALVTGITGQDGSYLSELLLSKGYEVHGIVRRVALEDSGHRLCRIQHIRDRITLHAGSLESYASLYNIIGEVKPDECYHLAAQSFVSYSFEDEFSTIHTNINGTLHVLSAVKHVAPGCKLYFAGSSEMFGKVRETPQTETTPFHPRSPYGISKVAGFEFTRNYREAYDLFACNGMLFNHESPRRGFEFVSRKITSTVARIAAGRESHIELGNLNAHRDWGFAGDYVYAMWLMLQQATPDDYVIGSGTTYRVRTFVEKAFECIGVNIVWKGTETNEIGIADTKSGYGKHIKPGDTLVKIDKLFFRPSEVELLVSDSLKAKQELGWSPKITFDDLVSLMVNNDLELTGLAEKGSTLNLLRTHGFTWIEHEGHGR